MGDFPPEYQLRSQISSLSRTQTQQILQRDHSRILRRGRWGSQDRGGFPCEAVAQGCLNWRSFSSGSFCFCWTSSLKITKITEICLNSRKESSSRLPKVWRKTKHVGSRCTQLPLVMSLEHVEIFKNKLKSVGVW